MQVAIEEMLPMAPEFELEEGGEVTWAAGRVRSPTIPGWEAGSAELCSWVGSRRLFHLVPISLDE